MEQSQASPTANGLLDSHETPLSTLRLNAARLGSIDLNSNPPLDHRSVPQTSSSPVKRKPVGAPSTAAAAEPSLPPGPHDDTHVAVGLGSNKNFSIPRKKSLPNGEDRIREQIVSPPRRPLDRHRPILSPDIPQSPGFTPFHELPPEQARQVLQGLDINSYSPSTLTHARNSNPPESPLKSRPRPYHRLQLSENMPGRTQGPGPIQILPVGNYAAQGPPTPSGQNMSKFGAFFGWKGNKPPSSPVNGSSPTTISDRSTPAQSPNGTSLTSFPSGKMLPSAIDTSRANAPAAALFSSVFPQAPPTPTISYQLDEMEEELREISSELAGSIRREMELEEEVERLQMEGPNALEKDKRTSDYFSDSGASSNRDPEVPVMKVDDMEKMKRRSEQEKAQMKLDLSQKLQEERARRKKLEEHVRSLEEHVQNIEQGRGGGDRVVELERRLSEEKRHKVNFEEMMRALRDDCESHKNERDNLRDEIVPGLRARVEGLEAESSEYQKLTYENTRMQQELQALKSGSGLSRSGSLLQRSSGLGRSNSIKQNQESRDSLAERVKDVEAQRDALHRALKSLLDRQKMQTREQEKRVKTLLHERDTGLETQTPRRKCFEREVSELRAEIDHLRKRADDALAQKWQCEKGLGGLKTDLDRAEQETGSLRRLLQEHDILVPDSIDPTTANLLSAPPVTSATLEQACRDLASAQAYAEGLREASAHSESESENLARQLDAAGQRVEVLSSQVKRQLTQNGDLRERLAQAVSRGERQQKESAGRVAELQTRLRSLEDGLSSAQGYSEESIQAHEDEVRDLRLAGSRHKLQRLRVSGLASPAGLAPRSPFSPFASEAKSPRLAQTSSGPGVGMADALRTEQLESRVRELERALKDAEAEMGEVVQRMNLAQMEVMELQTARDDAMKMTRALQNQLEAERHSMSGLTKSLTA